MRWLLGVGVLFVGIAAANWWIVIRPLARIDAAPQIAKAWADA